MAMQALVISASPTCCSRDVVQLLRLILNRTDPFSNEPLAGDFSVLIIEIPHIACAHTKFQYNSFIEESPRLCIQ
ncbi:hypothetical protein GGH92_005106 [Coemansia sp. RSA 2673]|nr:hypothetical protein GGH92_005106 [Coemansia sp. RSA 2673]KAJ2431457.1 hypothetical protein GGF41_000538 [Coemansia sp. RSA 2531]